MAHVVVMYKTPKDTAAFDKYYFEMFPLRRRYPACENLKSAKAR
jgi:uncharacterized protein (TIGR02118 family)